MGLCLKKGMECFGHREGYTTFFMLGIRTKSFDETLLFDDDLIKNYHFHKSFVGDLIRNNVCSLRFFCFF